MQHHGQKSSEYMAVLKPTKSLCPETTILAPAPVSCYPLQPIITISSTLLFSCAAWLDLTDCQRALWAAIFEWPVHDNRRQWLPLSCSLYFLFRYLILQQAVYPALVISRHCKPQHIIHISQYPKIVMPMNIEKAYDYKIPQFHTQISEKKTLKAGKSMDCCHGDKWTDQHS